MERAIIKPNGVTAKKLLDVIFCDDIRRDLTGGVVHEPLDKFRIL